MTYQLPEAFIPKYQTEVELRAQQSKRALAGAAMSRGMFKGDKYWVPRFGQVKASKMSRLEDLALSNKGISWLNKDTEAMFVAFGLWDPDKDKLTIDMAGQFAEASVMAIDRALDAQHVAALADAAANGVTDTKNVTENVTTVGSYTEVADLDLICQAIVELGTMNMYAGQEITIITPFKVQVQNALDPYLAKNDVKGNRPWDNLIWRNYELLPGNGTGGVGWLKDPETSVATDATGVDIFIHAKSAVSTLANTDPKEINERLGSKMGDMIGRWFQADALVTEPKGIIRIKSKLDFSLARKSIPVIDTGV